LGEFYEVKTSNRTKMLDVYIDISYIDMRSLDLRYNSSPPMITPHTLPDSTPAEKRPPLRQIAEMLGVSKMTVSRALREGTSVDAALRARIQLTARKIGYQPDTRISQVMSAIRKSKFPQYHETLALIWTHKRPNKDTSFHEEILSGARLQAEQLGYKLDEFRLTDQAMSGRALSHILYSRGIRGALIAPPDDERSYPHIWLDWKKISAVLIGRSFVNRGLARVQPDHHFACALAVRRLKRLGYRRIGLVISRSFDDKTGRLVSSAFTGYHPLGYKESAKLVFIHETPDSKALDKWISQSRPDVVIAQFENGFPRREQLQGPCGRKVDLVALNWNRRQPSVAGVNLQVPRLGEAAVDLLVLRMQRNIFGLDETAPVIQVPGSWMDGLSIRSAQEGVDPEADELVPGETLTPRTRRQLALV
jgi:LacI family transcriptional regulator